MEFTYCIFATINLNCSYCNCNLELNDYQSAEAAIIKYINSCAPAQGQYAVWAGARKPIQRLSISSRKKTLHYKLSAVSKCRTNYYIVQVLINDYCIFFQPKRWYMFSKSNVSKHKRERNWHEAVKLNNTAVILQWMQTAAQVYDRYLPPSPQTLVAGFVILAMWPKREHMLCLELWQSTYLAALVVRLFWLKRSEGLKCKEFVFAHLKLKNRHWMMVYACPALFPRNQTSKRQINSLPVMNSSCWCLKPDTAVWLNLSANISCRKIESVPSVLLKASKPIKMYYGILLFLSRTHDKQLCLSLCLRHVSHRWLYYWNATALSLGIFMRVNFVFP